MDDQRSDHEIDKIYLYIKRTLPSVIRIFESLANENNLLLKMETNPSEGFLETQQLYHQSYQTTLTMLNSLLRKANSDLV